MTVSTDRAEGAFHPAKSLKSRRLPVEDPNDVGESMRGAAKRQRPENGPDKGTLLERQMSGCDSENVRRVAIEKFLAYNAREDGQSLARGDKQ